MAINKPFLLNMQLVPDRLNYCTMGKDFLTANFTNYSNYAN